MDKKKALRNIGNVMLILGLPEGLVFIFTKNINSGVLTIIFSLFIFILCKLLSKRLESVEKKSTKTKVTKNK